MKDAPAIIKKIMRQRNWKRQVFADYFNVNVRTVDGWLRGNPVKGPSSRLMEMLLGNVDLKAKEVEEAKREREKKLDLMFQHLKASAPFRQSPAERAIEAVKQIDMTAEGARERILDIYLEIQKKIEEWEQLQEKEE